MFTHMVQNSDVDAAVGMRDFMGQSGVQIANSEQNVHKVHSTSCNGSKHRFQLWKCDLKPSGGSIQPQKQICQL
jgi:hypothetical protein